MTTFILTIGLINLAAGFGVAFTLHQLGFRSPAFRSAGPSAGAAVSRSARQAPPAPVGPSGPGNDGNSLQLPLSQKGEMSYGEAEDADEEAMDRDAALPARWEEILREQPLEPRTAAEAAAWVLRIEVQPYRDQLLVAERRLRSGELENNLEEAQLLVERLREINQEWINQLTEAAGILKERTETLEGESQLEQPLSQELLDQTAMITEAMAAIDKLKLTADLKTGAKRFLIQICRLIRSADAVGDQLYGFLGIALRADDRLADVEYNLQLDRMTEFYNRLGMECIFDRWHRDGQAAKKELALVAVDIDRFHQLNAEYGHQMGDRVLRALGQLFNDLLRKNRGFDYLSRMAGQTFCLFLGGTNVDGAVCAAERLRQVIEATSFKLKDLTIEITVSCAVAEVEREEPIFHLLGRLQSGLKEAKRAGRNRTYKDDVASQSVVEPEPYQVKAKIVSLEE